MLVIRRSVLREELANRVIISNFPFVAFVPRSTRTLYKVISVIVEKNYTCELFANSACATRADGECNFSESAEVPYIYIYIYIYLFWILCMYVRVCVYI